MVTGRTSPKATSPKALDRETIEQKALSYLDRFDASAARLRRVLEQFVRRRAKELCVDVAPYLSIVDETLTRYQASGLVDDRRYGAAMARTLAARGTSRQAIRNKLLGRGMQGDVIDAVVAGLGDEVGTDLEAARALVKKRRMGNYRPPNERKENYRRDLGALARAGFDFDTAKAALSLEGLDEEGF